MNTADLYSLIRRKRSYLCVGLDTDLQQLPPHLGRDVSSVLEFNKAIINATASYAVSFKLNTAFYEQYGADGWSLMEDTLKLIPDTCFKIADAKRGDIGNSGEMYARAIFDNMSFDSITVNPYMGHDSIKPFLRPGKVAIVLGLTSNPGSRDFQFLKTGESYLFERVIETSSTWGDENQLMFVVGATQAEMLKKIRNIIPNHFILVPGVGQQGGSLENVSMAGMNKRCGLLVNSSRGIIYASSKEDFAERAGEEAKKLQIQMDHYLTLNNH